MQLIISDNVTYLEGYTQSIRDLAGFINNPAHPLAKKLCSPKGIAALLGFVHENAEEFMKSPVPEAFDLEFEVVGKNINFKRAMV